MVQPMTIISVCIILFISCNLADGIGVNWGTIMSQRLPGKSVTGMLLSNGLNKVKLFDADPYTMRALRREKIEVMIAIPNQEMSRFSDDYDNAKQWVKENVTAYLKDGDVNIKYVAIGNEPFLEGYNGTYLKPTFPALQNIQKALDHAGIGDKIKATIPFNADVYTSPSNKPSDGTFRDDVKDLMIQIVKFLRSNNAPFIVNIYPFLSLYENPNFPFDFAFFDGGGTPLNDNGTIYTNVFDANYDTLVWSLNKIGVPDMNIIVGEIGWPTDGNIHANIKNAKRFYDGILKKLATNEGTPLRPGPIEVYVFSLFDENMKSILPGNFERHWGIFKYDGTPKFPMDFSEGNETLLSPARGIEYLPLQWCAMDKLVDVNMSLVEETVNFACKYADCSTLGNGSSCNDLDMDGKISYAYNMYFQMQGQAAHSCDFEGFGGITTVNKSAGSCIFPVQIMSAGVRTRLVAREGTALLLLFMVLGLLF